MKKLSEFVLDVLGEVVELLDDLLVWRGWVDELHLLEAVDDGGVEGLFNQGHRDLLLNLLGLEKHSLAVLVVSHDALHHSDGLGQGAVVVVWREGVLLQELILDQFGDL